MSTEYYDMREFRSIEKKIRNEANNSLCHVEETTIESMIAQKEQMLERTIQAFTSSFPDMVIPHTSPLTLLDLLPLLADRCDIRRDDLSLQFCLLEIKRLIEEIESLKHRVSISEEITRHVPIGYFVFRDLKINDQYVDLCLITPNGLFVLEIIPYPFYSEITEDGFMVAPSNRSIYPHENIVAVMNKKARTLANFLGIDESNIQKLIISSGGVHISSRFKQIQVARVDNLLEITNTPTLLLTDILEKIKTVITEQSKYPIIKNSTIDTEIFASSVATFLASCQYEMKTRHKREQFKKWLVVGGVAIICTAFLAFFLIIVSHSIRPYEMAVKTDAHIYDPTGDQIAHLIIELPEFRDTTLYEPLIEIMATERDSAQVLYDKILQDAIIQADKDPDFAALEQWVEVTSFVEETDKDLSIIINCRYFDGAASSLHGYRRKVVLDFNTGMVRVEDIEAEY